MSKHTPGPWQMSTMEGTPGHCLAAEVYRPTDELDGAYICTVNADDGEAVANANAHLIAAAPALLDELRDRYDMTKCGCGHWACTRCRDDAATLAVIREAQGETE